jgi:WD40 repeat protein
MHHSRSKKEIARRVAVYIVMTFSVLIAVGFSLFWILGYSIDEKTGRSERGGLMQFRSFPDAATVTIDGGVLTTKTPTKSNQRAGYHSITMARPGYREWSKNTTLRPGELLWMNALLIPKSITTSTLHTFSDLHSISASPDKKWLIAVTSPSKAQLTLADLRDEKQTKFTELALQDPNTGVSEASDQYTVKEWDFGSKYILLTYTRKDGTIQWIRADRNDPKNTINISKMFDLPITDMHFSGTSGNVFYGLTNGTLRRFDISQKQVTSPVATDVVSFELYKEDILAYVTNKDAAWNVYYAKGVNDGVHKVATYRDAPVTVATVADYYNETYFAVGRAQKVELYKFPQDKEKKTLLTSLTTQHQVERVLFSNNGRFLVAHSSDSVTSYDLERQETFRYTIPGVTSVSTVTKRLRWLDDFHLWNDTTGQLTLFEYDGTNSETIAAVAPGNIVSLSTNGKRLISVGANAEGQKVLQSSRMVIED